MKIRLPNKKSWILFFGLLLLISWPAIAALQSVTDLFSSGNYEEARQNLIQGSDGARPGEEVLWKSRLTDSPNEAVDLLSAQVNNASLSDIVRLRMALEIAEIEYSRGNYRTVEMTLKPFVDSEIADLPGELFLRRGLALRAVGNLQRSREMLASVKPGDPAFSLARYYLGEIGLQQDDPVLAIRYFDSAETADYSPSHARLAAGRWKALRADGQNAAAEALFNKLKTNAPTSLSLMEIQLLLRQENEDYAARAVSAPVDSAASEIVTGQTSQGRYSIQLGAFSDRGLALELQRRYRTHIPEIRIDQERDDHGQFLYKVRVGHYVNPARARTECRRIENEFNIETIITDLAD